jgi:hypothetical protein
MLSLRRTAVALALAALATVSTALPALAAAGRGPVCTPPPSPVAPFVPIPYP